MSTEIVLVRDKADLAQVASARIASFIQACVQRTGVCTIALAGGGTPRGIYQALVAREDVPWAKVRLFFGDERCVPPDHEDSNFLMVKTSMLDPLLTRAPEVFRMRGEDSDREAAARAYQDLLPAQMDLVLLGMGPDGHTASLFPGDAALEATDRLVMPVFGSKPPPWRLTLTPPVIAGAAQVMVFALGESKASKLREVMNEPVDLSLRPVQLALGGVWFVDAAAAKFLTL